MSDLASDQAALATWCTSFLAGMLERAPSEINPNTKFARMGVDSVMSVELTFALEELLDIKLSPDVIADHPTISRLTGYLATIRSHYAG